MAAALRSVWSRGWREGKFTAPGLIGGAVFGRRTDHDADKLGELDEPLHAALRAGGDRQ